MPAVPAMPTPAYVRFVSGFRGSWVLSTSTSAAWLLVVIPAKAGIHCALWRTMDSKMDSPSRPLRGRNDDGLMRFSSSNQIHQRKQKNPDDVHEMPIQPGHHQWRGVLAADFSSPHQHAHRPDHAHADQHVQAVVQRHRVIEEKEQFDPACMRAVLREIDAYHQVFVMFVRIL